MRGIALWLLLATLANALPVTAEDSLWLGELDLGVAKLRTLVKLSRDDANQLSGSFASIDQSNDFNEMDEVSFENKKLSFVIRALNAKYEGEFDTGKKRFSGQWIQNGNKLDLDLVRISEPPSRRLSSVWAANLDAGGAKLPLVVRVFEDDGVLDAIFNSPTQTAQDFPATVEIDGKSVKIYVKSLGASFEGTLSDDGARAEGFWIQGASKLPVTFDQDLKKVREDAAQNRPQHPKPPFPYRTVDVQFDNAADSVTLAGTLTLPSESGKFPAVVLISGSGPQDRDETIAGHKPFLVIADHLTRGGIAVLRYDERGVGKSTGDFNGATSVDLARDVKAAIEFLRSHEEVEPAKIGLIGHSEGGYVAPMVAAESPHVQFVVTLAGPAVSGEAILLHQQELILRASGAADDDIQDNKKLQQAIVDYVKTSDDFSNAKEKIAEIYRAHRDPDMLDPDDDPEVVDAFTLSQLTAIATPWFQFFLQHDPVTSLRELDCPVLALYGERDLQVDPRQNVEVARSALEDARTDDFEVVEFPQLNHLFQGARTGLPGEYARIEETIAPVVLEKIHDWIRERAL